MKGVFHPCSHNLGGENKGNRSNKMWDEGGSKKEKKTPEQLLLLTVSIETDSMMNLQVDSSSGPRRKTDLLCNKRWTACFWELEANTWCIPHKSWRIGPILPSHNWPSMKAPMWFKAVDNLLAPAKTVSFFFFFLAVAIVVRWDKRKGQDAAPAAVHTGQETHTHTQEKKPSGQEFRMVATFERWSWSIVWRRHKTQECAISHICFTWVASELPGQQGHRRPGQVFLEPADRDKMVALLCDSPGCLQSLALWAQKQTIQISCV